MKTGWLCPFSTWFLVTKKNLGDLVTPVFSFLSIHICRLLIDIPSRILFPETSVLDTYIQDRGGKCLYVFTHWHLFTEWKKFQSYRSRHFTLVSQVLSDTPNLLYTLFHRPCLTSEVQLRVFALHVRKGSHSEFKVGARNRCQFGEERWYKVSLEGIHCDSDAMSRVEVV